MSLEKFKLFILQWIKKVSFRVIFVQHILFRERVDTYISKQILRPGQTSKFALTPRIMLYTYKMRVSSPPELFVYFYKTVFIT